ncbi:hypothetical protein VN97_g9777, partial [Penicillium thymicola]
MRRRRERVYHDTGLTIDLAVIAFIASWRVDTASRKLRNRIDAAHAPRLRGSRRCRVKNPIRGPIIQSHVAEEETSHSTKNLAIGTPKNGQQRTNLATAAKTRPRSLGIPHFNKEELHRTKETGSWRKTQSTPRSTSTKEGGNVTSCTMQSRVQNPPGPEKTPSRWTFKGLRGPAQTYQWPARYMGPIHMISL